MLMSQLVTGGVDGVVDGSWYHLARSFMAYVNEYRLVACLMN